MNKREVAHALRTMGALLEVKGEDSFKVRSYERAADSLEGHDFDLVAMAKGGRLTEIPGIGKNLEPKVSELVLSGRSSFLESLVQEVPPGILDLLRVPGIGPKTARLLHSSLGVAGLPDLRKALAEHRVQGLSGMGRKREELMQKGLTEIERYAGRLSLGIALPVLEDLVEALASSGLAAQIVGETRRYEETVASLDVLVKESESEEPWKALHRSGLFPVEDPLALQANWDEASRRFSFSTSFGVPLRVFFCGEEALDWRATEITGPRAFVDLLEKHGRDGGLGRLPPELRHRPEFADMAFSSTAELERVVAQLVSPEDIQGDLHIHTTWSDGVASVEDMVAAAREMGYRFIAITDHATEIKMIRGLNSDKLAAQVLEIESLRPKYPDIRILTGVEVDILRDGRLFLENDLLSKLDVVVASVHQDISDSRGELVNRLVKAASNPVVDILGHITGRVIGRRPGVTEGLTPVFEAAVKHGTALEVNASPERLDLPENLAVEAVSMGANLAVCTDAHAPGSLRSMRYGVYAVLRRAAVSKDRVLNASCYPPRS